MTTAPPTSAAPRRLSRTFGADADRRRLAGAAHADRHHSARWLSPSSVRGRADARQRHRRSHRARQHSGARLERCFGAAICRRRCRTRHRGGRRRSGSQQSACRARSEEILDRRRARRRSAPCAGAARRWPRGSAPKVSVAIDGGGALNLDGLAADVRLRAETMDGDAVLRVGVGGDGASAAPAWRGRRRAWRRGRDAACSKSCRERGRHARARDIRDSRKDVGPFRSAIADLVLSGSHAAALQAARRRCDRRASACATDRWPAASAFAFGHADAARFERLIEAARDAGAQRHAHGARPSAHGHRA